MKRFVFTYTEHMVRVHGRTSANMWMYAQCVGHTIKRRCAIGDGDVLWSAGALSVLHTYTDGNVHHITYFLLLKLDRKME